MSDIRLVPARLAVVPHLEAVFFVIEDNRAGLQDEITFPRLFSDEDGIRFVLRGMVQGPPDVLRLRDHRIVADELRFAGSYVDHVLLAVAPSWAALVYPCVMVQRGSI